MGLWEYIKAEFAVLKQAPLSFLGLVVFSLLTGVAIASWHYGERLETKDGEIHRYRVALGIDEASKGSLTELNNQELALRSQLIVAKLRQLSAEMNYKLEAIRKLQEAHKIDEKQAFQQKMGAQKEVSEHFDQNLASDAYNLDNELRRRLDPSAISHIIRVPSLGGSNVTVPSLFRGTGFDSMFIGLLADEIEQMAKLLP